uniref:KASH domain-containing protein n=2 Tax=Haemonchus contortus TaxID=6289 RepID=A0A7I4Z2H3_HAECO|nr:uncoordinated protein 83 [Haemonchus contortus]
MAIDDDSTLTELILLSTKYLQEELSDKITEVDLFLENCSSLYNLILDALHNLSSKTLSCQQLDEMVSSLAAAGRILVARRPETETTVALRINTINSAMEQLRLRRYTSDSDTCSSRSQPSSEIRGWIHLQERRLIELEERLKDGAGLTKLLSDQQILQLEIQSEGQALINRLNQQFKKDEDSSEVLTRRKLALCAIRKRWHNLYLNSLCLQCRIEDAINRFQESSDFESDPDLLEPPTKRVRRFTDRSANDRSEEEETRSRLDCKKKRENVEATADMERNDGNVSVSSGKSPAIGRKWDSGVLDIGYSSGENSLLDVITSANSSAEDSMMRRRSERKASAIIQTDVLCDELNHEALTNINRDPLTDSMLVNCDVLNGNSPEYDEVMALLDDSTSGAHEHISDSFNTKWREIGGQSEKVRRRRIRTDNEEAKHSCDASSEESSDWETRDDRLMNKSFNDFSGCGSLPGARIDPKSSSSLLDSAPLDASFCSTKSELAQGQCRNRKRLRVRRLPRSMSDGEQLILKSGAFVPKILRSPPSTPLARSTRLLQKLELDLMTNSESDITPEQSDTQVYEWDDYNPPAKDDSMAMPAAPSTPAIHEGLLELDEDFSEHLDSWDSLRRLISESRAHLRVVEKSISSSEVDEVQLESIQMIARANLRQLDTVMRMSGGRNEDVACLREQWKSLFEQAASPIPQLLNKVECFANSLRDLHEASSNSSLSAMTAIKSKEDVRIALEVMSQIQSRLCKERDELRVLLSSPLMVCELTELSSEFTSISSGYDDAVERINNLVSSLQKLDEVWSEWSEQLKGIRDQMNRIEDNLKADKFDQLQISEEMELCQERMNSLETMCNYLTTSLQSVQGSESSEALPDFRSEISLYENAMEQLKTRFQEHFRIPTPPGPVTIPTEPQQCTKRRVKTQSTLTQTSILPRPHQSLGSRLYKAIAASTVAKLVFILALLATMATLIYVGLFGTTFGPHLIYVNGPPPV